MALDFLHSNASERVLGGTCTDSLLACFADPETPESLYAPGETRDLVRAAIGGLTKRHAVVILARYYDGLTFQEIADVVGVTQETIVKMHAVAVKRLRESLSLMGVDTLSACTLSN